MKKANQVQGNDSKSAAVTQSAKTRKPARAARPAPATRYLGSIPCDGSPELMPLLKEMLELDKLETRKLHQKRGAEWTERNNRPVEENTLNSYLIALRLQFPGIQAPTPLQKFYKSIRMVSDCTSKEGVRRCLGFLKGRLVRVERDKAHMIGIRESVSFYARLENFWYDKQDDTAAKVQWLKMVHKAIAA